ncbi:MAG: hypothetical protein JRD68_12400 [Deltaproteobacteria bacterium]|nr:hypothetical protein [Deltaproteobacteria bacterium]
MSKKKITFWALLISGFLGLFLTAAPVRAEEMSVRIGRVVFSPAQPDRISLVVSVFNEKGRAEEDLGQDSFLVEEDGQGPFGIDSVMPFMASSGHIGYMALVDTREDLPTSLSMVSRGLGSFITEMGFRYSGGILTYTGGINIVARPTKNAGFLLEKLNTLDIMPGKPFLADGLMAGIRALERVGIEHESKLEQTALILLTDGLESDRLVSLEAVQEKLLQNQGVLFVIGFGRLGAHGLPDLAGLAAKSGGGFFFAHTPASIEPLLSSIARRLKHSYVLNYSARKIRPDGGLHTIRVSVKTPSGPASSELRFIAPGFGKDRSRYAYAGLILGLVPLILLLHLAFRPRTAR